MKVLIRCDAGLIRGIGSGHLKRSLVIASGLVKEKIVRKKDIFFLTCSSKKYFAATEIRKKKFQLITHNKRRLKWNSNQEAKIITAVNPDLLILDRLSTTKTWVKKIKEKSIKILTLDDLGSGKNYVDTVINSLVRNNEVAISHINYLQGSDYLILDPELCFNYSNLKKKVTRIIVGFGGYDFRNLLSFTLNVLSNLDENKINEINKITFFTSLDNKVIPTSLLRKLKKSFKSKVEFLPFSDKFFKELSKSDIAILSGGMTIFYACHYGVPTIGLPQYKHQLDTLNFLRSKNCILLPNQDLYLSKKNLMNSFLDLLSNYKLRSELSRNSMQSVDGKGLNRLLLEVDKLLNN